MPLTNMIKQGVVEQRVTSRTPIVEKSKSRTLTEGVKMNVAVSGVLTSVVFILLSFYGWANHLKAWSAPPTEANRPTSSVRELPRATTDRAGHLDQLFDWFLQNGGVIHQNLKAAHIQYENYDTFGVIAKGDVYKDEILVQTNRNLILTANITIDTLLNDFVRVRKHSSLGDKLTEDFFLEIFSLQAQDDGNYKITHEENAWEIQVCLMATLVLVETNNPECYWYPYLHSLPSGCQNSDCWSAEEQANILTPSMALITNETQQSYINYALKLGVDPQEFLVAISKVSSRCWGAGPDSTILVLMPVMDIFNHDVWTETMAEIHDDLEYSLFKLEEEVKTGQEVFIHYSDFDSVSLLMHYGFVAEKNPEDNCDILQESLSQSFIDSRIQSVEKCYARGSFKFIVSTIWTIVCKSFDSNDASFTTSGRALVLACIFTFVVAIVLLALVAQEEYQERKKKQ